MHRKRATLLILIYLVWNSNSPVSMAAESDVYWYEVTMMHGNTPYGFYGSSKMEPENFAEAVGESGLVRLDGLMYRDKAGDRTVYKDWTEWDRIKLPYMYINTQFIIAVHPLAGDPQKADTPQSGN